MKIGTIDLDREVLLIAEIGNNHEGNPGEAVALAEAAMESGAHAVKVQVIDPRRLVAASQADRIRQLDGYRLSMEQFGAVARRVREMGGLFMASAFDIDSLHAIAPLLDGVKVASGDLDFHDLVRASAGLGLPMVMSTGMATLEEVGAAVQAAKDGLPACAVLAERLALLHCVSLYPTPPESANLAGMATLRDAFGLTVGYSDHTLGIEVAAMSIALGARVIEKHFTLDKARSAFRDHALSADPDDMKRLAHLVRHAGGVLGNGRKDAGIADRESAKAARRSIVAARAMPAGHVLAAGDLEFLRPGTGLSPALAPQLRGRRLKAALDAQAPIRLEDLE